MLKGSCHCGAAGWTLEGDPGAVTACNCTLCRRYGVLWAYDYENERIRITGPSTAHARAGETEPGLEIRFCPTCGCVLCWRGLRVDGDGRRRIAVNVRLAPPEAVAGLPIDHFDGLDSFEDLPRDGRCPRPLVLSRAGRRDAGERLSRPSAAEFAQPRRAPAARRA